MKRWFTLIAGASLLLTACATPAAAPAPAAGGAPAAAGPKLGGTLNGVFTSDPFDWDPSTAGISIGNYHGWQMAYESLIDTKTGPDVEYNDLTLQPGIAEKWEISPDATTYTFHLRKGVKFANLAPVNGREVTSADVKWSYEYQSRTGAFKDNKAVPPGKFISYFEGLDSITTPDPLTAVVKFKQPFSPFLSYAAEFTNPIMPHEVFDKAGSLKDTIIGTGAFQLDPAESQKGARWVFKKNADYWQNGKPYLDAVRWLVIPEESTITAAFNTRQIDVRGSGAESAEAMQKANPNAVVYPYVNAGATNLYMNVRRAPLNDVRVRRAISLAMDRDETGKIINGGQGSYAMSGVFPGMFTEAEMRGLLRFNPEEAKKLLAEAGYANGLNMEIFYPGKAFGEANVTETQLLQAQLKKVGINLTLKSFDLNEYLSLTRANTYDITLRGSNPGLDIDAYLYGSYHPTSNRNYNGVDDPKLTAMIDAQRREPDQAKRKEIQKEAAKYIAEQAWGLASHATVSYQMWQPYVKNYRPNYSRYLLPAVSVWLDK